MNRLTDNDKQISKRITYGREPTAGGNRLSLCFKAYRDTDYHENPLYNTLVMNWGRHYLRIQLPSWIKPVEHRITPDSWDAATIQRLGRNWYPVYQSRRYGFSVFEDAVILYYGVQNNGCNSNLPDKDQQKYLNLPWKLYTFIGQRWYSPSGVLVKTHLDKHGPWKSRYDWQEKVLQKSYFTVIDQSDNSRVNVSAFITEREWHRGTSWCKWLKWFYKPLIKRVLEINFEKEVGPAKSSWKGGLMGTSIEIAPGETPLQAMQRYCDKEHSSREGMYRLTLISSAS